MISNNLNIGDSSDNGQITIVDQDRLCYLVKSVSKGATGLRTISKKLLIEYVDFFRNNPNASSDEARGQLSGTSDIDKFEYGYSSTLKIMAQMILNGVSNIQRTFEQHTPVPDTIPDTFRPLLTAIRTKPFILLAGISGTGKSRIVRKLAQASVSEDLQKMYDPKSVEGGFNRWQLHKPANFELIQVKPNWHNSLEVVGYKSNIGGAHYEFTPFVEFVARAWKHPETPFFLCLDEMNLAPVEQYFAEFLSAIESRSIENNEYETDPIIKPFESFDADNDTLSDRMIAHLLGKLDTQEKSNLADRFRTKGLALPQNLIILGTVNMDETTFSFSRKVFDRAMSIVMDDVDYESYFNGSSENNVPEMDEGIKQLIINRHINGLEVKDNDADAVKNYLTAINAILDKTPFKLGYRAANEALLYVSAAHSINPETATNAALDEFTLMKILSRIEGDKRSIDNLLENLKGVITIADYPKSYEVLDSMSKTLNSKQFVSYWTK